MIEKFIARLAPLFFAAAAFAVDVNRASQAELEVIKGIGPTISARILDERRKGHFKDWNDLVARVNSIGEKNAEKSLKAA